MVNIMCFWSLDLAMLYSTKWYGFLNVAAKLRAMQGLALNTLLKKDIIYYKNGADFNLAAS